MIVTCVQVRVKQEHVADFIEATRRNHYGSVKEPGNVRFDVAQRDDDPTHFLLYEAYRTPQEALAHKETQHYQEWRDEVADWMAEPRQGIQHNILFPESI